MMARKYMLPRLPAFMIVLWLDRRSTDTSGRTGIQLVTWIIGIRPVSHNQVYSEFSVLGPEAWHL